jgi:hypothetical protein
LRKKPVLDRGGDMSGPIQNNPNVDNIVQNPQSVNEHEQELTKVTEVAIGTLGSPRPPSPSLDPARVKLAVSKSFEWCWNFKKENDHLIWTTKYEEESIYAIDELQFPVLQPTKNFLKRQFGSVLTIGQKYGIGKGYIDSQEFLEMMGFSYKDGVFRTPTREQFVINYNRYQESNPIFPELVFRMANDILEPDEFISSVLESDLILSDKQELIHDYTYHIIPTLNNIFQSPEYYRRFKALLGQSVRTFQEFLKREQKEILTELNKLLETPIEESDFSDTIATLKYMVGAALDVLSGQILFYEKILEKGDARGGVKDEFFKYIIGALVDKRWRPNLVKSVPSLKQDFVDNYPDLSRWEAILKAIFTVTGLNKG